MTRHPFADILATALLALGLAAAPARAQAPAADVSTVTVQGLGIVRSAPDLAFVRIGAESRAKSPREAQAANAEAMNAVQQKLAAAGVGKDALRTTGIVLQQEYDYANGKQIPRGYVASNEIEARVDDLAKLGEVMDAAAASGATAMHGLRFELKQRDSLERDALKRAVADGMARAESAAAGARRAVDRLLRIEEQGVRSWGPQPVPMMGERIAMSAAPPTPVAQGEIEIRAQVTVTVTLK